MECWYILIFLDFANEGDQEEEGDQYLLQESSSSVSLNPEKSVRTVRPVRMTITLQLVRWPPMFRLISGHFLPVENPQGAFLVLLEGWKKVNGELLKLYIYCPYRGIYCPSRDLLFHMLSNLHPALHWAPVTCLSFCHVHLSHPHVDILCGPTSVDGWLMLCIYTPVVAGLDR